jgi:PAS domain S-box-containing protein
MTPKTTQQMTQQNANLWPALSSALQELPAAYTEMDANGIVRAVNEAACRQMQMTADQVIGRDIWEFIPPDEAARSRADFFDMIRSGEDPPVIRRSLYNSRGGYRIHEVHRRLMRDADGATVGVSCVSFDISQMDAAYREARQTKLWLESVVEAIPQAVMVTDSLGFVRFANPSAQRLTGRTSQELVGQQIEKGMPILRAVSKTHKPLSFRIALDEPWNGDVELLNRQGEALTVWLSACPIFDKETAFTNGVVIVMKPLPIRSASVNGASTSGADSRDAVPASEAAVPALP